MQKNNLFISLLTIVSSIGIGILAFFISTYYINTLRNKDIKIFPETFLTGANVTLYMPEIGPQGKRIPNSNWDSFSQETEKSFHQLYNDNIRFAAIVCRGEQANPLSTIIYPESHTMSDSVLLDLIHTAKKTGIIPIIKPHLFINGSSSGRGLIGKNWEHNDALIEKQWFNGYKNYILHFAKISQQEHLPYLIIAVELPNIVIDTPETNNRRDGEWRDLIKEIRAVYKGKLTYAANSASVKDITWWDALDYIGVDAYFTLTTQDVPTLNTLKKGWTENTNVRTYKAFNYKKTYAKSINILDELEYISNRFHKPIIFTEIGYRSAETAASNIVADKDNEWNKKAVNLELQANLYQAMFDVLKNKSWLKGIFFWSWYPGDIDNKNISFLHTHSVQGKPAEDIIRNEFAGFLSIHQ